ncbi:MAG: nucleotidyl transferase AbiEii/AbiGii toxin family protein [Deltaproteobacteria bacterium]|nr:nucleotidyl transferase AbiEii/AbiGii toxin family protein [Deltaproteobacteria bacterium]
MRTPLQTLKRAVKAFEKSDCSYCLIGGHAASLYRKIERVTRDVDFAMVANTRAESRKLAESVIKQLGFQPVVGFIPPTPEEGKRKSVVLITSRPEKGSSKGLIDILLPELPWIEDAVERAQHNRIDLGFSKVPVITPEDLIVAKCYALRNSAERFQDLDDLKEIFQAIKILDWPYLKSRLKQHRLSIPEPIQKYAGAIADSGL